MRGQTPQSESPKDSPSPASSQDSLRDLSPQLAAYRIPEAHPRFSFPRDHGSHPCFRIEWWYLTGHLQTPEGRRFGWQATFFRTGAPLPRPAGESPAFRTDDLHLAHMALSDIEGGQFHHAERLDRAGWDAVAASDTLRLRQGPWSLQLTEATPGAERLLLQGGVPGQAAWQLSLQPTKPLVIFGEDGRSRKGDTPDAVSWYLSWTRLEASGQLILGDQTFAVSGLAWMDHEISSHQLGAELVGWDWAGIHLDDGREIKAYRLRLQDGTASPWSRCLWIDRSGRVQSQDTATFAWIDRGVWSAPDGLARYPTRVEIRTVDPATGQAVRLWLEPLLEDQELRGRTRYWEGACRVTDEQGRPLGRAYLELVGYAPGELRGLRAE